jgi:hypothetical protein
MRYNNQAITFLPFEVRSAENLARWGEASPARKSGEASPAEELNGASSQPHSYCSRATARELPTADTETREVVLAPARTVTGVTKSSRSRSNSKGGNGYCPYRSRCTHRELPTTGIVAYLGAHPAVSYCSRATARELPTADTETREVVLAPARTVTGVTK